MAQAVMGLGVDQPRQDFFDRFEDEPVFYAENPDPKELGRHGEDIATYYLQCKGYEVLERNWTCTWGEADIIARSEDGCVVLVEVKTRHERPESCELMPELAVDEQKQKRYQNIALAYYNQYFSITSIRFDVIAINLAGPAVGHLRHICNAYRWGA